MSPADDDYNLLTTAMKSHSHCTMDDEPNTELEQEFSNNKTVKVINVINFIKHTALELEPCFV